VYKNLFAKLSEQPVFTNLKNHWINFATKLQEQFQLKPWLKPALLGSLAGFVVVVALFSLFFASGLSSTFVRSQYRQAASNQDSQNETPPEPSPEPTPPIYSAAVLGYGGAGHDGGLLTDSIMVAQINTGTQQIALVSVPRDSWVALPSQGWDKPEQYWKVNAAYAIGSDDRKYPQKPLEFTGEAGGGSLARYALEQIVGFPIDHFIAVDFTGFKRAVDVLGGITVQVDRPLTDPFYPIPGLEDETCEKSEEEIEELTATMSGDLLLHEFTCRFEVLEFSAGSQHMDGETALNYVRSRHAPNDGGDFNRSRRQRSVLFAVRDKILAIDFIPKLIPFIQSITGHVRTDMSLPFMREMLEQRDEFLDYQIVPVPLTTDEQNILKIGTSSNGQSIVLPKTASASAIRANEIDWQPVWEYVDQQLRLAADDISVE
jgi:polyisoprenyl-teichoic acid--peptidoglycan teichoic acid transferase